MLISYNNLVLFILQEIIYKYAKITEERSIFMQYEL